MREIQDLTTVSNVSNHLIGYERLLDYWKDIQQQCPKGVGLKKDAKASGTYVLLQFTIGLKRTAKACNCPFTFEGIANALSKAKAVREALDRFNAESDFWEWYDSEILEKNRIKNDLITFREAIEKVEVAYWKGHTKKHGKRDKTNPSHQESWHSTYGVFFKKVNLENAINLSEIKSVIESYEEGSKSFKHCVCAYKKLCEVNNLASIRDELSKIDVKQTLKIELQSVGLDDFLEFYHRILNSDTKDSRVNLESRKQWLFVFSLQVVYGLRVHECFAILNINEPFKTKDKHIIPALNDPKNKDMIAVIGNETILGTTTKTGYRLAVPLIPPTHPNLLETLNIKEGELPQFNCTAKGKTLTKKYASSARRRLIDWGAPFTQSHALRHLANLNGMMAGISLEKRAMSLGHSPTMNDNVYKKRQTTKTTLDLLNQGNNQAITLESAILSAQKLGTLNESSIKLMSTIYGVSEQRIMDLAGLTEVPKDESRETKEYTDLITSLQQRIVSSLKIESEMNQEILRLKNQLWLIKESVNIANQNSKDTRNWVEAKKLIGNIKSILNEDADTSAYQATTNKSVVVASKNQVSRLVSSCKLKTERKLEAEQILDLFITCGCKVTKGLMAVDCKQWILTDSDGNKAGLYLDGSGWNLSPHKFGEPLELKGFFDMDFEAFLADNDIEVE